MSNIYNGIELTFDVNEASLESVAQKIESSLKKRKIELKAFSIGESAKESIANELENGLKDAKIKISNILVKNEQVITGLKNDIQDRMNNRQFKINKLAIDLDKASLIHGDHLAKKVSAAISNGSYTLKITNVDASAAIKSVQEQLRAALESGGFVGSKTKVQETAQDFKAKQEAKRDATVKGQRYKAVEELRKELSKIETAANKEGVFARSGDVKAKIHQIAGSIDYLQKRIESMGTRGHDAFNGLTKDIEKNIAALNGMIAEASNPVLGNLIKVANTANTNVSARGNAITDVESLSRLKGAWDEVQQKIREATDAVITFGEPKASEEILPELQKIVSEYSEIVTLLRELNGLGVSPIFNPGADDALGGLNVNGLRAQADEARRVAKSMNELQKVWQNATKADNYNKNITISDEFSVMEEKYKNLINLHEQYKMATSAEDRANHAAAIEKECVALEREVHDMQELVLATNNANRTLRNQQNKAAQPASAKSMTNLAGQIQDYLKANSSISKNPKTQGNYGELSGYLSTLRSAIAGTSNVTNQQLDDMAVKFKQTKQAVKDLGLSGQTMAERFLKGFEKFGGWMIITSALMELVNGMHKAVENVFELDAAMTQLRKVTDETETTYQKFYDTAVNRSKEIGSTLSNMINATADFARLGYNITDAQKLAEQASIYYAVGDGVSSIEESTQSLISTLKAFYSQTDRNINQIQAAEHIVDVFNELGNTYPIDSTGVGAALQRSASALSSAGNTMEQAAAMAVAANTVVQDPEKVGEMHCPAA